MIDVPKIAAVERRREPTTPGRGATVVARWAIDSKKPGRYQGYRPFGSVDAKAAADHLIEAGSLLGTTAGRNAYRVDELPWVAFLGGATVAPPMWAVVSRNWSDSVDGSGAPILPTRAIWLTWDRGARRGVELTYAATYARLRDLSWPAVDGGPAGEADFQVNIPAPAPDWDIVVDDIARFGVEFIAELAAHVAMDDQVVVVVPEAMPIALEERIRLLDAIAALLPFGARNCIMVATWAHHHNRHLANLSFAAASQPHQVAASLTERTVRPPVSKACEYLAELRSVLAEDYPLDAVVARLRRSTKPLAAVSEITAEVIAGMRLPRVVDAEIRRGATVPVDRARASLVEIAASGAAGEQYLRKCVEYLARRACDIDSASAAQARKALTDLWDEELAGLIGEYSRREPEIESHWAPQWLAVAARAQQRFPAAVFGYIHAALRPPVVCPDQAGFRTLVHLVVSYLSTADRVDSNVWPLLLGQRHVLTRALHTIVLRPSAGEFAMMWARRRSERRTATKQVRALGNHVAHYSDAGWLTAILLAASDLAAYVEIRGIRAVLDGGAADAMLFVEILTDKCDPDTAVRVLVPVVDELFCATSPAERESSVLSIVTTLLGIPVDRLEPEARATLDVWRFALDIGGDAHPAEAAASAVAYGQAFRRALARLDPPWAERVARNAARFFVAGPFDFVDLDAGFRDLIREPYLEELMRAASTLSADRVRQLALTLPDGWWDQVADTEGFRWYRAVGRLLAVVRKRAGLSIVTAAADSALEDPRAVPDVLSTLLEYVADSDVRSVDRLLRHLHTRPSNRAVALALLARLISGGCGLDSAQRFSRYATAQRDWYGLLAQAGAGTDAKEDSAI